MCETAPISYIVINNHLAIIIINPQITVQWLSIKLRVRQIW